MNETILARAKELTQKLTLRKKSDKSLNIYQDGIVRRRLTVKLY